MFDVTFSGFFNPSISIAGVGLISSVFGIVLAFYPPAQVKAEVGSPVTYVIFILLEISFNSLQLTHSVHPHQLLFLILADQVYMGA